MSGNERLICDILRGAPAAWHGGDDPTSIEVFLTAARYHGVLPLLDAEFRSRRDLQPWPTAIQRACRSAVQAQAMYELALRAEIARVLEALVSTGAAPLLLKGTALAYSHYANPALRPRADTDLLIPPDRRTHAERALGELGYTKATGVDGDFISHQANWSRVDALGAEHNLDIHWRINNSPLFAGALGYDELMAQATKLPVLGPHARAPAPAHSLLFACIHRASHANAPYRVDGIPHFGGDRLIWLYDMHLLAARMPAEAFDDFAALATAKAMRSICGQALQRTVACFATPIPDQVIGRLNAMPVDPSFRFTSGGRARQMVGDFLALDGWADRGRWLKELGFPPAGYMRSKYPEGADTWLPILYARRAITGVVGLVTRRASPPSRQRW